MLFCLTVTFPFPLLLISRALSILSMSKPSWVPGWMLPTYQWFSKYGPWTRSFSITWQVVAPHQTYWVRNSGSGVSTLNLTAPPGDFDVCSSLRTTLPYSIALNDCWEDKNPKTQILSLFCKWSWDFKMKKELTNITQIVSGAWPLATLQPQLHLSPAAFWLFLGSSA